MMQRTELRVALAGATFAAAAIAAWVTMPIVTSAAIAAGCAIVAFHLRAGKQLDLTLDSNANKVGTLIESGRKLVIYERETGLFAHWYVTLRCEEECDRAARYKHEIALLLVEPADPQEAWAVQEQLADWIRRNTRATDIAGYLGNGRFIVLMPETDKTGALELVRRVTDGVPGADWALSGFPADGVAFDELYRSAAERLKPAEIARAA